MLAYILKSTICLVLLLAFYHNVLEKEKMHRFNRFYLLGAIIFSCIVPSFTITVAPTEFVAPLLNQQGDLTQISTQSATDYTGLFIVIYSIISLVLLSILSKKIYQILEQTKTNKSVNYFTATVILLKEKITPYTFLHYIFINKKTFQSNTVEQQILTHELAHVQQKHSLDILFIEVLQNLFWFNPIFRYYKKAIQLNHEFLADDAVLQSHQNITEYQYVLLNTTAQQNSIYLASNLNYSLTKKRLLMMTTPSSKTKILFKKLMVIPLTAGFIFAFAQRVEAQEKKKELIQVVELKEKNSSLSRNGMKAYEKLFNAGKKNNMYKQKDVQKMIALYKTMSKKQQQSVTDIRKVVPPPPPIDIVFTYKKLTKKIQSNSKNRKANIIYLKKLYGLMTPAQKKQVTNPSRIPIKIEVIEIKEKPEIEEIEVEEVVEAELREVKEIEVIEVRELKEIEETEVIKVGEIVVQELKEFKKKHGNIKIPPPPPPLKKNATKKEIERYNKAYKIWKEKVKNIPPPPKKQ